jgi:hypothetical protein
MRSFHFPGLLAGLIALLVLTGCGTASQAAQPTQIAGTEQQAVTPTDAPAATQAPAAGLDVNNPAPLSETVTSAGWEFSVVEVLRGDEALSKLQEASPFNGPPEDATLEWAVLRIHVRYVGDSTEGMRITKAFFESAGSDGTLYDRPKINDVSNPEPELDAVLLPGEEAEGWITVFSPKGQTGLMLVIQPYLYDGDVGMSTGESDRRYISLEP